MTTFLSRHLVAAAAIAALALPALAQPPAGAAAHSDQPAAATHGGTAHNVGERGHHAHPRAGHGHAERHSKRIEALKTRLQLSAAQEPAWNAYTSAIRPTERRAQLGNDRQAMAQLSTPERIDRMRALRAQHAAEADRRGEATKTFYAALTPAQQKTFDATTARADGPHGKPRHHKGPHGHGGERPLHPKTPVSSAS